MKPLFLALRAIGTAFALRLYIPLAIAVGVGCVLLFGGVLWLTTLSEWWWLLMIPVVSVILIVCAVGFVVFSLIRYVRPPQTNMQKQAVGQFVDKIQAVADIAGTPKFLVLLRVVRSIAAPKKDTYLSDLVQNRELASDFRNLQRLFDTKS